MASTQVLLVSCKAMVVDVIVNSLHAEIIYTFQFGNAEIAALSSLKVKVDKRVDKRVVKPWAVPVV